MLSLTFKTKSVYCNCIWYKINLSTTFGTESMCCHRQSGHLHLEQNQCLVTCVQDKISFLLPTFGTNRVVACILDTYIWNKINVLLPAFRTPTSGTKSASCNCIQDSYIWNKIKFLLPAFRDLHLEQNQRLLTCIQDTYIWNKINVLLHVFRTPTSGEKKISLVTCIQDKINLLSPTSGRKES